MMNIDVVPETLSRQTEDRIKPAMAGQPANPAPAGAGQGRCPVDPKRPRPPLPSVLGIKLTSDLRGRIAQAAKAAGISDSAWLRARALEALGVESAVDAASGRRVRVAPEDQMALAGAMRDIGEASMSLQCPTPRIAEALAGLQRAREAVIPIIVGFERRA